MNTTIDNSILGLYWGYIRVTAVTLRVWGVGVRSRVLKLAPPNKKGFRLRASAFLACVLKMLVRSTALKRICYSP